MIRPNKTEAADLKLGVVADFKTSDTRTWSGTPYFMTRALRELVGEVEDLGPGIPLPVRLLQRARWIKSLIRDRKFEPHLTTSAARLASFQLGRAAKRADVDFILAMAGSHLIPYLNTRAIVAYTSDATLRLMANYYPSFVDLAPGALRRAEMFEQRAIDRADLLFYPSEWAAKSAIEDYGADPGKVHILPYGANLHAAPTRDAALASRSQQPLKLVFVGVDWARKGGDLAVDACAELNRRGINAELTIVGCQPPDHVSREHLKVIPFLSKDDAAQARQLSDIYLAAHFFILPTRMECVGMVLCEAAAHGLPAIGTLTGGVECSLIEGATGHMLPPEANGVDYADLIAAIWSDQGHYEALRAGARDAHERTLNWQTWAECVMGRIQTTIDAQRNLDVVLSK